MLVSNRNLLFQWSIFRGYVSLREGKGFVLEDSLTKPPFIGGLNQTQWLLSQPNQRVLPLHYLWKLPTILVIHLLQKKPMENRMLRKFPNLGQQWPIFSGKLSVGFREGVFCWSIVLVPKNDCVFGFFCQVCWRGFGVKGTVNFGEGNMAACFIIWSRKDISCLHNRLPH